MRFNISDLDEGKFFRYTPKDNWSLLTHLVDINRGDIVKIHLNQLGMLFHMECLREGKLISMGFYTLVSIMSVMTSLLEELPEEEVKMIQFGLL